MRLGRKPVGGSEAVSQTESATAAVLLESTGRRLDEDTAAGATLERVDDASA